MKLFKWVGNLRAILAVFGAVACDDGSCEDAGRTFEDGSHDGCCECVDGDVVANPDAC